jgi:phage terminase small subunit
MKALDLREAEFARRYAEHGQVRKAALEAGYPRVNAEVIGRKLLDRADISLGIARAARPRLMRSLPMALTTLDYLCEKATSERVRLEAAKAIVDRCGLVPPKPHTEREGDIPLHEMTLEELQTKIAGWMAQAENDRASRAKIVNPAADLAADSVD